MEISVLYCIDCGQANPWGSLHCSRCNQEITLPHPIELDGGMTFSLPCSNCNTPIAVLNLEGRVICDHCGFIHAIEQGQGYLTMKPVVDSGVQTSFNSFTNPPIPPPLRF